MTARLRLRRRNRCLTR